MKTKIFLLWAVVVVGFVCVACEKEEDFYDVTYYDVVGEDYVFMYDTNGNVMYPVKGAEIEVSTTLENSGSNGWYLSNPKQIYYTDTKGKYQIRYIKHTYLRNATTYYFTLTYIKVGYNIGWCRMWYYSVDKVKDAKNTIILDTIKLCINEIQ